MTKDNIDILSTDILTIGKRVLNLELCALEKLQASLDHAFCDAVRLLAELQDQKRAGRLIITGMGKSGHIGKKIAATMASTGTPAQFVHPAEAAHGDLGMITQKDMILAISNSGETNELAALLDYATNHAIHIIAITAKANSTLAKLAKIALILPDMPEASEIGLAPTTSTTMTLALGDALAVALLEHNGFSPVQFHKFHPGGKLGQSFAKVEDYMHQGSEIPLATGDMKMKEAIIAITQHRFGSIGIIDAAGCLVGIVTDGDLRRNIYHQDILEKPLNEIMTHQPKTLDKDIYAKDALLQMHQDKITVSFVVNLKNQPIGIVHIHDLSRNIENDVSTDRASNHGLA